jgi:hypothetical protein
MIVRPAPGRNLPPGVPVDVPAGETVKSRPADPGLQAVFVTTPVEGAVESRGFIDACSPAGGTESMSNGAVFS